MNNVLKITIIASFLIMFDVLFFVIGGTDQSNINWTSFVFIHIAYVGLILVPLLDKWRDGLAVIVGGLYLWAFLYFIIELLIGLLFIIKNPVSNTWPLIIQSVLLVLFVVVQSMSVLANHSTVESIEKQKRESSIFQIMGIQLKQVVLLLEDDELRKKAEDCYDLINNSSIESFEETKNIETSLKLQVTSLLSKMESGQNVDIATDIQSISLSIQKRNDIIKIIRYK